MTPESALHQLLLTFFAGEELRRWIRYDAATSVIGVKLPGSPVAPVDLATAVVDELVSYGLVDEHLFSRLRAERPRRQPEVDRVEAVWRDRSARSPSTKEKATMSAPSSSPPPPMSSTGTAPARATAGASAGPRDVAILVALKEEWEILWTIAGKPGGDKDPESGRYLFRFEVPSGSGRAYRCVALFIGEMGPGQATNAAVPLLRERPKLIVNVGIAAAIHDDLRLCDVVVADQVDDYLATVKAVPRGKTGWEFELRGNVYKTTHSLVQDVDALKFAHHAIFEQWQSACAAAAAARPEMAVPLARALKAGMIREAPAIARVHLASGPVLAAAEAFSQWVRGRDGLLKALEMEAAGMMLAAHHQGEPTPTLVLRGISDYGDSRKAKTDKKSGGAFRYLAMANATELLWSLMRRGILPRHQDGAAGSGASGASTGSRPGAREGHASARGPARAPSQAPRPRARDPWDAVAALTGILHDGPRHLVEKLDARLPGAAAGPGEPDLARARRVAEEIDGLGDGFSAAEVLIDACGGALDDIYEEHRADYGASQGTLRLLLSEWMPRRYEVLVEQIKRGTVDHECPDLVVHTESEIVSAISVAAEERRSAEIQSGRGKWSIDPPSAVTAEMRDPQAIAELVADDITGGFFARGEVPRRGSDPVSRRGHIKGYLDHQRRQRGRRHPRDLTLPAADWDKLMSNEARHFLKDLLPALRQVDLTTPRDDRENALLVILDDIFRDDDGDGPPAA